jgi:hypothetical protein
MRLESMGVSVSDTKADMATAPAITKLNSRNNLPVVPCIKTMGKNTAINAIVVESMAK